MSSGIDSYRKSQQNVAPEQLVTLLLRTAIARLTRLEGLDGPDDRWVGDIHHVRCILIELRSALDPEVDAELVGRLADLYSWCLLELIRAGTEHNPTVLVPVRRVLDQIYEGWQTAVERATSEPV